MPNNKKKDILKQKLDRKIKISKAHETRTTLMLKLSRELRESKMKEVKLRKEIQADLMKNRSNVKTHKEKDKISVRKMRTDLAETKQDVKAINSTKHLEVKVIKNKIKESRMSVKKKHNESLNQLRLEQQNQVHDRKIKQSEVRLKNIEANVKLKEKEEKQKIKLEENKNKRQKEVLGLKEEYAAKQNKLKNLRSEQRLLAQAKRQEKSDKIKKMREERIAMKADAKLQAREELAKAKLKHVDNAIEHEKDLNEIKDGYEKEFDEIEDNKNVVIENNEQSVIDFNEEMTVEETVEEENIEYTPPTEESFFESYDIQEDKVEEHESYLRAEAKTISSYGKAGLKKARRANETIGDNDLTRYNKQPLLLESINAFREKTSGAIDIQSLAPYLAILLDIEIPKEKIKIFVNNIFAATLLGYTVKLGNGFLSSMRIKGNNIAQYTTDLLDPDKLVILINEDVNEAGNTLIAAKIKMGGDIKIGNGLIITQKDGELMVHQETNFTKA